MTSSIASQTPFSPASSPAQRPLTTAARLFTRPPFAPCTEPFAALPADDIAAATFPTTPTKRLLEVGLGLSADQVEELFRDHAVSTDCYAPTTLHYRDRSVYAWFETVGLTLTVVAVSVACAALLIG